MMRYAGEIRRHIKSQYTAKICKPDRFRLLALTGGNIKKGEY
jgi:hypothetical protein